MHKTELKIKRKARVINITKKEISLQVRKNRILNTTGIIIISIVFVVESLCGFWKHNTKNLWGYILVHPTLKRCGFKNCYLKMLVRFCVCKLCAFFFFYIY